MLARHCRQIYGFRSGAIQSSLLVGGPGTAKTTIVKQFLARFPPDTSSAKDMTFSYFTTPGIFQRAIEVRCALLSVSLLSNIGAFCWC